MSNLLKLINSHVRHDVLNDLTTIRSILEVYQDTKNDELLEDALKKIDGSADFLKEMKEVESMVSEGELKPLNLKNALSPIHEKYKELNFNVQGDCTVMADDSLTSIFDNLVRNSVTHGNADRVDIKIINKDEVCQVEVADNGEGISDEIYESVFEEGVSTNGTGVGLYIVKKTVERYGGSIQLVNSRKGTTFVMLLNTPAIWKQENRDLGIEVIGDVGWGTHICHFYQTKDDLLDVLLPYFKAGVNNNEYCIWVTSEFSKEEAQKLVEEQLQGLEVFSYDEWYNTDDNEQLLSSWTEKLNRILAGGYDGLRVSGDAGWLDNLKDFINYEEEVHRRISEKKMIAICSYPFSKSKTSEIADLTSKHHYTLVVREGKWELIENYEYRRTQNVLQELEDKYRALVENANEGIVVVQDGKIVYVNPIVMDVSGYSKEEMMYKPFVDFIHPNDRESVIKRYKEGLNGGGADSYQFRFKDKWGNTKWAEVKVTSVDWDGKPAALNFITDITVQKEAEDNLQEMKTSYQELFDKSGDAVFVHDPDTAEILDVNQRMCALYGYSREEALNLKVSDLSSGEPYNQDRAKEWVQKAMTGEPQTFEWQGKKKDGTVFWVEVTLKKATIGGKDRVLASVRDITERKQSEKALKEAWNKARKSEKLYSTMVEKVNDMVFMLDSKGNVTFFNSYVKEHYSLNDEEPEKLFGTHISFFWCDESLIEVRKAVDKVIEHWEEQSLECFCGDKYYLLKITPLLDSGELTGMIAVARDITEHKQVEEALRERGKNLSDIVEGSPVPTFVLDENHKVTHWNKACEKISGVSAKEVVGTSKHWYPWYLEERPVMADLIIDGDEDRLFQYYDGKQLSSSIKEGAYEAIDYFPHLGEDGRWLYFTACPLKDEKGRINGAIETIQDVTERKRAEEDLRKSEDKNRAYVDNSPVAIFIANRDGESVDVNSAACQMLGYTRDELLGMSIIELDKTEESIAGFEELKSSGKYRDERKLKHKDGSLVDVDLNAVALGNGNFMAFCSDITEKRMAQKSLKESEARYRATFEHTGTAMIVIEEDATISMANKECEKVSGYSREEIEGRMKWTNFVHPDDLERMLSYHSNRRMGESVPNKYEFKMVDREGNVRDIFITIDVIPGTNESIASLLDVTHLRRLNRLLKAITDINEVVSRIKKPEVVLDAVCKNLNLLYEDIFACVVRDGEPIPVKSEGVSSQAINMVISKCPSVHKALEGQSMKISTNSDLCQRCTKKAHKYALSIPLIHESQQGIITIHSNSDFSDEEVTLLNKLASNIAFALSAYEVAQDKKKAMEQLASNLTQFDMAADRLRNPLAITMSVVELKDKYEKGEALGIVEEQTERIKKELDELRREESATYKLLEQSKLKE